MRAARGFTLIETMYAAAVFGIGLVGVVSLLSKSALYSRQSANLAAASMAAVNRLERIKTLNSQNLFNIGSQGPTVADINGLPAAHPRFQGPFFTCSQQAVPVVRSKLSWMDVSVTCSWVDGASQTQHGVTLSTSVATP